ncbi:hypothetical protein B0H15DRAFT_957168 [Mycena belliarum]|uniref:Uncharacterized protein n=1 Tax=Mycena belliarum TaxID=1033014 RepID=A0AAD6XH00_9AGAR|nr:hypothetical protein B0H15DRAFT_957168 [Mycena belliae]
MTVEGTLDTECATTLVERDGPRRLFTPSRSGCRRVSSRGTHNGPWMYRCNARARTLPSAGASARPPPLDASPPRKTHPIRALPARRILPHTPKPSRRRISSAIHPHELSAKSPHASCRVPKLAGSAGASNTLNPSPRRHNPRARGIPSAAPRVSKLEGTRATAIPRQLRGCLLAQVWHRTPSRRAAHARKRRLWASERLRDCIARDLECDARRARSHAPARSPEAARLIVRPFSRSGARCAAAPEAPSLRLDHRVDLVAVNALPEARRGSAALRIHGSIVCCPALFVSALERRAPATRSKNLQHRSSDSALHVLLSPSERAHLQHLYLALASALEALLAPALSLLSTVVHARPGAAVQKTPRAYYSVQDYGAAMERWEAEGAAGLREVPLPLSREAGVGHLAVWTKRGSRSCRLGSGFGRMRLAAQCVVFGKI